MRNYDNFLMVTNFFLREMSKVSSFFIIELSVVIVLLGSGSMRVVSKSMFV